MTLPVPVSPPPGLSTTGMELIASAMRLIGALEAGENPDGDEAQDGIRIANQMIDQKNTEDYNIFHIARTEFTPATLKQVYTVGSGGDFDMPRPPKIQGISIIQTNGAQPLELPLYIASWEDWQSTPTKQVSSALSQWCYPDYGFPFISLNMWPIPSIGTIKYALYTWASLQFFADLGKTRYSFPPGYAKALRFGLAVELADEWGGDPLKMPGVRASAKEAWVKIKAINRRESLMKCDPASFGGEQEDGIYNWLTDTFVGQR